MVAFFPMVERGVTVSSRVERRKIDVEKILPGWR
jgi:hypothetical protein